MIDVGKVGGGEQVPQEETTRLLVERALAGRDVVRLKGGDPFVFGRGGEEAQACRAAGIPFEVVPGVTAGVAAPAYAGIPVTQRNVASAVAFVTGHEDPAKPETAIDWPALARFPGTLVFYMGVRQLGRIAEQLIAGGRAADEPVAVVERGTLARPAHGARAAARHRRGRARPPGCAPRRSRSSARWRRSPTSSPGSTTARCAAAPSPSRARGRRRARSRRACATSAPPSSRRPRSASSRSRPRSPTSAAYDLVCITSPNGAHELMARVRDARALTGPTIAVIGPGTARALREHGIEADIVPSRSVAEGLVAALAEIPARRALIARAEEARDVLPDGLRARGVEVDILPLYRTIAEPLGDEARAAALGADYATFTSASSARFLHAAAGTLSGPRLVSIGPATSAAMRELGFEPDVEAADHTPDGLVAALLADASGTVAG